MSSDNFDSSEKLLELVTLSKMMSVCKSNTPETKAMMNIIDGASTMLESVSEIIIAMQSKKKLSNNTILNCQYAIRTTRESLEQYMDIKINRMRYFLHYFRSLDMEVPDENNKLKECESRWQKLQTKLASLCVDEFQNLMNPKIDIITFQNELQQESKLILSNLGELEETVFRNIRNMITLSVGESISQEMKNLLLKP